MTLEQLRKEIDRAIEEHGGDTKAYVAYQPSWPLAGTISGLYVTTNEKDEVEAYVVSPSQRYDMPYAPGAAFDV